MKTRFQPMFFPWNDSWIHVRWRRKRPEKSPNVNVGHADEMLVFDSRVKSSHLKTENPDIVV